MKCLVETRKDGLRENDAQNYDKINTKLCISDSTNDDRNGNQVMNR